VLQDEDHGAWLEEALADLIKTKEHAEQVRRGAMLSLDARQKFWDGVQSRVVKYRQPLARTTLRELVRLRIAAPDSMLSSTAKRIGIAKPVYRPQLRAMAGLR